VKIIFDYWDDTTINPDIPSEIERVGRMIEQGFTSGELTAGEGCGWWSIQHKDE